MCIDALKPVLHAIFSYALTSTNPCYNKTIHVPLMHSFLTLHITFRCRNKKMMSSTVTSIEVSKTL